MENINHAFNKSKALEKCNEATQILSEASKIDKNKDLILKASDLFIEASLLSPNLSEPYISLSYINALFEDYETAIKLLNTALEIDPNNNNIKLMLEKYTIKYNLSIKESPSAQINELKENKTENIVNNILGNMSESNNNYNDFMANLKNLKKAK